MSDPALHAAPPRRRVQFTVRTFFVAAVLVSLFAAAASIPGTEAMVIAISLLAWLTFALLYWTLGATAPLVALPVGTLVLGLLWCVTLPFVPEPHHVLGQDAWLAVPIALGWGIAFSIIVALSRALRGAARRWRGRRSRNRLGQSPFREDFPPAIPAWETGKYVLFTRLILTVVLLATTGVFACYPQWPHEIPAGISLLIDAPLVPLIIGFFCPSPPASNLAFILATAVLNCPLHAGTGWIVGLILARRNRRLEPVGSPATEVPVKMDDAGRPEP